MEKQEFEGNVEEVAEGTNKEGFDRRGFLKGAALGAIGIAGAGMFAGCSPKPAASSASASGSSAAADFKADETVEAELVVIGAGAAGMMAAHVAAKNGVKVTLLEKGADFSAPNGFQVSGPFAVETDVLKNKEGGTTLTVDDVFDHVMKYSHWTPNPALMRRCLETSKDAVAELSEVGYEFQEKDFRFLTPFTGEKGGFHLITTKPDERIKLWEAAVEKDGIDLHFDARAVSYIVEGDKVVGVNVKEGKKNIAYKAKAVIMCAGGYLGNKDLQERFLKTDKLNVARGGDSICTGDTILAAEEIGVALDKTFGYCPCEYGGTNSKASRPAKQDKFEQNTAFKFGLYGCLQVDAEGKRFINEGLLCDFPMSYGSEQIILNAPWYSIVDQDYFDAMKTAGLYAYTTAKGATTDRDEEAWFIGNYFKQDKSERFLYPVLETLDEDIEEGIKEGWAFKADTLKELGEHFGLTDLEETVKQYNEYCDTGVDAEFGCKPWYLSKVATPPFYVTQNEPSAWSTFGGVRTDDDCNVLKGDNKPLPGLYCAGTDSGSLYYSPYYDIPGFCYGLCIDSGYIAATEATKYIKGGK